MRRLFCRLLSMEVVKKPKVVIGTHDGKFHCDEALACGMLRLLPEYKHAQICRSRDPQTLQKCDIVVDVGGIYDPQTHRYDHHQRSFDSTMNSLRPEFPWKTKLSSAGLVYLHFGERAITETLGLESPTSDVAKIYTKVYENFIEEIDAVDNGIDQYDGTPRYKVTTTIGSRVGALNPAWNATKEKDPDAQFELAVNLVVTEFQERVKGLYSVWLPARDLVKEAIDARFKVDSSGMIISFDRGSCPWKEHLFEIEQEMGIVGEIKFALYEDDKGSWRVQCVPKHSNSFVNRLSLREEWKGLRDDELSKKANIPGCIFVHSGQFIGGNKTHEGALRMARESLKHE